jgi:type IV pilus assembly protein PilQ
VNLKRLKKLLFVILILITTLANAQQDRFTVIEEKLKELSMQTLGLNEKVELSVNGIAIQEFIRALATSNNLNVSVDPSLSAKVINNFSNVTVADVLLFLCKKYDLEVTFIGNIMSFSQYAAPPAAPAKYTPKSLDIKYDKTTDLLSLDLSNDSLAMVVKELTKLSQKNVMFSSGLAGKKVSGYIQNMLFNSALENLAFANELKVTLTEDNFYLIEKMDAEAPNKKNNSSGQTSRSAKPGLNVKADENKLVSVDAVNMPIADILAEVSSELKISYVLFTEPKGNISLTVKNATNDEFLNYLFNNTEYTFKKEGEIYLIGDRNIEGIRGTKVVSLKYRTVEKVIDFIPADLKKDVDIKTFSDQNSLILCGSKPRMDELEAFIRDIDRVVPVISIEVLIVDIRNMHALTTGIKAGLGTAPTKTGGTVFPELNLNLGANSINSIVDGINGLGIVNLGKVTPNFYLSLQLMEQNGTIKINSTPLLSTLNGHEAKMNIGETRYYLEQNSNVIATTSTTTQNTQVYKPLNAEFAMTINPIVSGDEQITMEITVKQSSFTTQTGTNGPYGTSSRNFQSLIRVKNQEMIMLGGLDDESQDESASGVPILSRIPIIKWFFSSRSKKKNKSKLTIFIKPTVIY